MEHIPRTRSVRAAKAALNMSGPPAEDAGTVHILANDTLMADKERMVLELTNRINYREQVNNTMGTEVATMTELMDDDPWNMWNLNDLRSLRAMAEIHLSAVNS